MDEAIVIRHLSTIEEMIEVEKLQALIWSQSDVDVVPAHLMITLAHNGGLVLGAFDGDVMVGFLIGFLGTDPDTPDRVAMARLKHCSHQMGVHPDYRNRGLGFLLKRAQREAVLEQGVRLATWTYDPLQSTNAYLNIRRLGAICRKYIRNAYGQMRDSLNMGVPSDRFQVEWWVTSTRVAARIEGVRPNLDLAHFIGGGALKVNPVTLGDDDLPVPTTSVSSLEGPLLLVEIPSNYTIIKERNPQLAIEWRQLTRSIFERAFGMGYIVTDFAHLKESPFPRSYYLLSHGEERLG